MKKLLLLSFIVITAVSCSSVQVSSDFDQTVDFSKYKTYAFTEEALALPINELNRNRLLTAIETELAGKGFTKSENPDVWIDIKAKLQEQQTAYATSSGYPGYGYGYGYRYGWGGGFSTTTINYDTYTDGTLFIDMIDVQKNQLVWQGRGTKTISENANQKTREENVKYAIKQIFMQYPPKIK